MFKKMVQKRLENLTGHYLRKHPEIKLIVVSGSVGKSSTKKAIATVLSEKFRVRLHEGFSASALSAPLAVLGISYPTNVRNPFMWLSVFGAAKLRTKDPSNVDVIVVELDATAPGVMGHYATYLKPDIAVVTAVSMEHKEAFISLDAIGAEEMDVVNFSKDALINRDDVPSKYAELLTNANIATYGTSGNAEFHFVDNDFNLSDGHSGLFFAPGWAEGIAMNIQVLGEHNERPVVAAAAVGVKLGMDQMEIARGVANVRSIPGRMNVLKGQNNSTIIDDSYSSSPLAAISAIKTLYSLTVPQRILVLGDIDGAGSDPESDYLAIANVCDPSELAWIVTVGEEAEKYLAPAIRARGCQVKSFKSALEAGGFVHNVMDVESAILFKGAQDGIFLEEAIKIILHSTDDETQLIRQSSWWMNRKHDYFSQFSS